MPSYEVSYYVRGYVTVRLEADNEDDAAKYGEDRIDWYDFLPTSVDPEEIVNVDEEDAA